MQSGLASIDESGTQGGAKGHAVDYDTLPTAILPVMSELFRAPLSREEEIYAQEVCANLILHACLSLFRIVWSVGRSVDVDGFVGLIDWPAG